MSDDTLLSWLKSDSAELVRAMIIDIQRHVRDLRLSGISFYGYAALPGDYCTQPDPASLAVAFNCESDLTVEQANEPFYRYSVDEWQNYFHDGFDNTNAALESTLAEFKRLHKPDGNSPLLDEFQIAYIAKINRAVLTALMNLKKDGTFSGETYLIIWYSDSDDDIINQSAKALNSDQVYDQYASAFN